MSLKPGGYVIAALVGSLVGMFTVRYISEHFIPPTSVHVQDLNADGRADVVVRNRRGDNLIYLQQENGSYQPLERVQQQLRSTIEDRVKKIK